MVTLVSRGVPAVHGPRTVSRFVQIWLILPLLLVLLVMVLVTLLAVVILVWTVTVVVLMALFWWPQVAVLIVVLLLALRQGESTCQPKTSDEIDAEACC